jgi:hypothetical protein
MIQMLRIVALRPDGPTIDPSITYLTPKSVD